MAAYRFPVALWADESGRFTAQLLQRDDGGRPVAAYGATQTDVLRQLKDYLRWLYDDKPWLDAPDWGEPQLLTFGVDVRPEYVRDKRVYPSDEAVRLRVACVHGRQENGLYVAALPLLNVEFYYYEPKSLRSLVVAKVQESLKKLTPQQLSRYVPPAEVRLAEITLQVKRKYKPYEYVPSLDTLKTVAEPLGAREMQRQFAKPYERDAEVADLVARLTRERGNLLIVGEPGVGKSTLLAQAVRVAEREWEKVEKAKDDDDDAPKPRLRFWLTSGSRLIAGMKYLGQWEERCEELIGELSEIEGVLCAENLLDLVQVGGATPNESIASFFAPYLQRGELRLVTEATPAELDACRRLLPGFADLFQVVNLPPFTKEKALAVLDLIAAAQERDANVRARAGVTPLVYRLFHRFQPYQVFPGAAARFLTELFERAARDKRAAVAPDDVIAAFARHTGLPELFLRDEFPLPFDDVLAALGGEVIGQTEAVRAAAGLVALFKAGLNDPARPVGVMLFCGPTGVGKTELAKALARFFFSAPERIVRLDMSEYTGYGAAERLVRNPDGAPSELIKRLRQQPFAVVLLDEIEKADPAVFDVLLSVFDEGRLTDRYGRATNFRSAIIIMTSNLGAENAASIGLGEPTPTSAERAAMNFFRPEFYNRFDAVVRFNPLSPDDLLAITRKELNALSKREGLLKAGRRLMFTDALVAHLARAGFEPRYGARPLQRAIETQIVAPLARYLLAEGKTAREIVVDLDKNGAVTIG
jgi:ATP-dependent Clp protease ATP-binding subunit ClpC